MDPFLPTIFLLSILPLPLIFWISRNSVDQWMMSRAWESRKGHILLYYCMAQQWTCRDRRKDFTVPMIGQLLMTLLGYVLSTTATCNSQCILRWHLRPQLSDGVGAKTCEHLNTYEGVSGLRRALPKLTKFTWNRGSWNTSPRPTILHLLLYCIKLKNKYYYQLEVLLIYFATSVTIML